MPTVEVLQPLEQPFAGGRRSIDWLIAALAGDTYDSAYWYVAFTKRGAVLRLVDAIRKFRSGGGRLHAVLGVDQRGTSRQALELALAEFDELYIWDHPGPFVTFHPKLYSFVGSAQAEIHVGSSNLTTGGLETNAESAARLVFALPAEVAAWNTVHPDWASIIKHANCQRVTKALINQLDTAGLLLDEESAAATTAARAASRTPSVALFPSTPVRAPSPLPKGPATTTKASTTAASMKKPTGPKAPTLPTGKMAEALLIQIVPHHNGEVFLSKRAIDQHPAFFGHPFSGLSVPKKKGNPPYPQRVPDPRTDWIVYDAKGNPAVAVRDFALNMVEYTSKSEIRITVSPQIRDAITPHSLLVMTLGPAPLDFTCEVHPPNSKQFKELIKSCNQTMPSGGAKTPRRFGWL